MLLGNSVVVVDIVVEDVVVVVVGRLVVVLGADISGSYWIISTQ